VLASLLFPKANQSTKETFFAGPVCPLVVAADYAIPLRTYRVPPIHSPAFHAPATGWN
jgi:hypothetical protein